MSGTSSTRNMSNSIVLSGPTDSAFEIALDEFKDELKKLHLGQRKCESFKVTSYKDLEDEIHKIQTDHHSKRRLRNMKRIQGFLEASQYLGNVIEVFCQTSEVVCFIWASITILLNYTILIRTHEQGPLKFLLQTASAHVEATSELLSIYEGLGGTLSHLQQCLDLNQQDGTLRGIVVEVYKDVLRFHRLAFEYFHKPCQ